MLSSAPSPQHPALYKGIALFTPGGDLVYCLDPLKQSRWHLQLCAVLQDMLGLAEPPHFLVPCYVATIDRWRNPRTQQISTFAEASSRVIRYQPLLNALFGSGDLVWQTAPSPEGLCDPLVLDMYQQQFPQLWQNHDLVVRFDRVEPRLPARTTLMWSPLDREQKTQGYVLRLYVADSSLGAEKLMQDMYQLLEQLLKQPYTLKIVDIHKHPEQAEADQITATPTLVKVWPLPVRRIVGNLEDVSRMLRVLALPDETLKNAERST